MPPIKIAAYPTLNVTPHEADSSGKAYKSEQVMSIVELHSLNWDTLNGLLTIAIIDIILSGVGVILNTKLYKNVKNETRQEKGKVIQRIMKTYAIVQTIAWPCIVWGNVLLGINRSVYSVFHPCLALSLQIFLRFFYKLVRLFVGFNSLIVALCQYLFVQQLEC